MVVQFACRAVAAERELKVTRLDKLTKSAASFAVGMLTLMAVTFSVLLIAPGSRAAIIADPSVAFAIVDLAFGAIGALITLLVARPIGAAIGRKNA